MTSNGWMGLSASLFNSTFDPFNCWIYSSYFKTHHFSAQAERLKLLVFILCTWDCLHVSLTRVQHITLHFQGSKKTFFIDKPRACGLWKWTSPDFLSDKPEKKSHIKILLVNKLWFWWVHYHLRTVIRNPRRNVELTMGRIKCKQSTSFLRSMMH